MRTTCLLAGVSRAGFYRSLQGRTPVEEEMAARSAIPEIAVEHRRRYGYRRITAELRRRGMLVNHERVLRILCRYRLHEDWKRPNRSRGTGKNGDVKRPQ